MGSLLAATRTGNRSRFGYSTRANFCPNCILCLLGGGVRFIETLSPNPILVTIATLVATLVFAFVMLPMKLVYFLAIFLAVSLAVGVFAFLAARLASVHAARVFPEHFNQLDFATAGTLLTEHKNLLLDGLTVLAKGTPIAQQEGVNCIRLSAYGQAVRVPLAQSV